jgi:two-component system, chemotaxis family, chemotaxis protein CheY
MDGKILIVDDSIMIHNMLGKVLENNGYGICGYATNGKEGLQMFLTLNPDLTFMDISMPVMDGLEAVKKIKERSPDARIIMLSAMGDDDIVAEAVKLGIEVFLKKPFDDYKIISALAKVF